VSQDPCGVPPMFWCQQMMVGRTGGANEMREDREEVAAMDEVSCTINSFVHDTFLRRLVSCVMDGR